MLKGVFNQKNHQSYVFIRNKALSGDLNQVGSHVVSYKRLDSPNYLSEGATFDQLKEDGYVFFKLSNSLEDESILKFSSSLGDPLPELPDELSSFVRHGIILEVKERFSSAPGVDMQPFSREAILVHTENSRSPLSDQPRYILFQCRQADPNDSPTYLYPMADVANFLSSEEREILSHLYYDGIDGAVPIFRKESGMPIFSFRDFGVSSLKWKYGGHDDVTDNLVNQALEKLLVSIYETPALRVAWEPNSVFVFDNFRYFHAKPKNLSSKKRFARHLDRVRIGDRVLGVAL